MVKTVGEFAQATEGLDDIKKHPKTKDGKTLRDAMLDITYIWSETVCTGYCLEAMEAAGIQEKDREIVVDYLEVLYDALSMQEAEERGRKGI